MFDMLHMNSIRVGLNSKEIVNGLGYEYLLKMMNDILLNFIISLNLKLNNFSNMNQLNEIHTIRKLIVSNNSIESYQIPKLVLAMLMTFDLGLVLPWFVQQC